MSQDVKIVMKELAELRPYETNPRHNDDAVKFVAASIKEFGFKVPLVVDADNTIVAGHTRYKAAQMLGKKEVPCIIADDLTEEQVRAYRLADNKTAEMSYWDDEMLNEELAGIAGLDMSLFGFDLGDELGDDLEDDKYTVNTNIPQYEITGEKPSVPELVNHARRDELEQGIRAALAEGSITEEEHDFLMLAAQRHNVFNYRNIAEYYAQATPEMQRLMEESALVIIDVNNAIANGYATLNAEVLDMMGDGNGEG